MQEVVTWTKLITILICSAMTNGQYIDIFQSHLNHITENEEISINRTISDPIITIFDTNVETGEVIKYNPSSENVKIMNRVNASHKTSNQKNSSVSAEVFIPIDIAANSRNSQSTSKTEAGVTAVVSANYSVSTANGAFTWYSFSGSWTPNQAYNQITNRSCGAVEFSVTEKYTIQYPSSNQFSYTLNWNCYRINGENPRVWSEATVIPAGMGTAQHVIELYMEF